MLKPQSTTKLFINVVYTLVIITTTYFYFLVFLFYYNGLHNYSYNDIQLQLTPNASDFPFTDPPKFGLLGMILLVVAFIVVGFGPIILPITLFVLLFSVYKKWYVFNRSERLYRIIIILAALFTIITMWSSLGRAISSWVFD